MVEQMKEMASNLTASALIEDDTTPMVDPETGEIFSVMPKEDLA